MLRLVGDEDRTTQRPPPRPIVRAIKATRDVVVDLSELHCADVSLMIDFACLAQRLRAQGRTLWLRDPQPHDPRADRDWSGSTGCPPCQLDGPRRRSERYAQRLDAAHGR